MIDHEFDQWIDIFRIVDNVIQEKLNMYVSQKFRKKEKEEKPRTLFYSKL